MRVVVWYMEEEVLLSTTLQMHAELWWRLCSIKKPPFIPLSRLTLQYYSAVYVPFGGKWKEPLNLIRCDTTTHHHRSFFLQLLSDPLGQSRNSFFCLLFVHATSVPALKFPPKIIFPSAALLSGEKEPLYWHKANYAGILYTWRQKSIEGKKINNFTWTVVKGRKWHTHKVWSQSHMFTIIPALLFGNLHKNEQVK